MKKTRKSGFKSRTDTSGVTINSERADASLWSEPFVHVLLILAAGFIVYFNTIQSPFILDDYPCLVNNPVIRDFSCFFDKQRILSLGVFDDVKNSFMLRPVAYFSFALNYALHGLDVRGYHIVNLLLHLGNALQVYLFVQLTLRTPVLQGESGESVSRTAGSYRYLPLFCALLFVSHPLQTQAVTYIIQRFVPLGTFFFLGTLVLYVHERQAKSRLTGMLSYISALAACLLAMKTKENSFTLPIVLCLYEFIFFYGNTGKRVARLIPFLLTMAIIPLKLMEVAALTESEKSETVIDAVNLANFVGMSSWDYLMSQFGVILTYLRLLFLPINQNFDYDYQLQQNFFSFEVLIPLFLLLGVAGLGVWLLQCSRKHRLPESGLLALSAFGIFWFFITLSVESSVIPIDDLIFEHRVYLPSVGFFMASVAGGTVVYTRSTGKLLHSSRAAVGLLIVVLVLYAVAGFMRNRVWEDRVTFWRDVVSKSPDKTRGYISLGNALIEQVAIGPDEFAPGKKLDPASEIKIDHAIRAFRAAITLNPQSSLAHSNLGVALLLKKKNADAVGELSLAITLDPKYTPPHIYLGRMYEAQGDVSAARSKFRDAIAISPMAPIGHRMLAALDFQQSNYSEALQEYEILNQLFPDDAVRTRIAKLKARLPAR